MQAGQQALGSRPPGGPDGPLGSSPQAAGITHLSQPRAAMHSQEHPSPSQVCQLASNLQLHLHRCHPSPIQVQTWPKGVMGSGFQPCTSEFQPCTMGSIHVGKHWESTTPQDLQASAHLRRHETCCLHQVTLVCYSAYCSDHSTEHMHGLRPLKRA